MNNRYIFTSERLGFRNWTNNDLVAFASMNADPLVMEHFPNPLTQTESKSLLKKLQTRYKKHGYTYFAVEIASTGEFIGFIGLTYQDYKAEFNPAVDIGWRLKRTAWGKGHATEGAKRCLQFAFENLGVDKVISVCTSQNQNSEHVMQKIGMTQMGTFLHPNLSDYPDLGKCVWYELKKTQW